MFWADQILEKRKNEEWINDAWTPSGIVHMGGLKGPVIHDVLYKVANEQGRKVKYTFGFDDMDPIDGLPQELEETHKKYMGMPVFKAPAPNGEEGTFSEYYGKTMRRYFELLGIKAEIYLASDYYRKGKYNEAIKVILDNVEEVRKIYEEMYKKKVRDDWYPINVICSNCGKLGSTRVTAWDGNAVSFHCSPDMVKWAEGCDTKGKISPFNGNAKLTWKVEWAAKWATFGVTIEGAGKDHASAGGSYDIAMHICKRALKKEPPLKLPYEFFLTQGKKMSSSKGLGITSGDLLHVIPSEIVRFLMIKSKPNHAEDFDPIGTDLIPSLYDTYQKAAEEFFGKKDTDLARAFELAQINEVNKPPEIRFSTLAQWVQMPNMKEKIKKQELEEWAKYAKFWVEKFAPENQKFEVKKELPVEVKDLSEDQRQLLVRISEELDNEWTGEDFQTKIYETGKELKLGGKETFQAIYKTLIGKDHGPKAGWLILSLEKEFVKKRFVEASK